MVLSILLLATGAAIGGSVTFLVMVRQVQDRLQHPEHFPTRTAARLTRALELSSEQRRRVESILREYQTEFLSVRREYQPRIEQILEKLRADVAAQLDAEQAARWQRLYEQRRRLWLPPIPPPASTVPGPPGS